MSNSNVALRGALSVTVVSAQLVLGSTGFGGQRPRVPKRAATSVETASQLGRKARDLREGPPVQSELEPPPVGDQIVWWAVPRTPRLPVKVRVKKSRSAAALGEARGLTALQVLAEPQPGAAGGCRDWLPAVPAGYVCRSEVNLQLGYASAPPAQESALGWQRYRYGVVTARQVSLTGEPGSYLRTTLHHGDGVTVVREVNGRAQLIGKTWLARKDIELATPSAMAPIVLEALPAGARPAWVVPAGGELQVPAYVPAAGGEAASVAAALLPRYSLVYVSDAPASPGRVSVQLAEETRAVLPAPPAAKDAKEAPEGAVGRLLELDAAVLRRFIAVAPPKEIGPEERWVDISLTEQVAAAYVGKTPLFAALVSTGKGHLTPPGSFFIYRKYLTQTMANQRGAAAQYDFRQVPHAQFFNGRIGLHAVLWHDLLGEPVSHGCVNLSPAAAAQFFAFSGPALPPGWHSVTGAAPAGSAEALSSAAATPAGAGGESQAAAERTVATERSAVALMGTRVIVHP